MAIKRSLPPVKYHYSCQALPSSLYLSQCTPYYVCDPDSAFIIVLVRMCGSVVVSTSACHAAGQGSIPRPGTLLCKNLALYIRDCVSLCLSDETLKAVGTFYLVSMTREVKVPTSLHWKCVTCRGLHILT